MLCSLEGGLMDAILLVGGFGTRLMPLTKTRPKPLIPLANVPFVERKVRWLRDADVDHIILSLHYNAEQLCPTFHG
jgi:mannose-1-phosphate guanylyltransferase